MTLTIRPLTPDLWPALRDLFGENGPCSHCWCMFWRIGSAYRRRGGARKQGSVSRSRQARAAPRVACFRRRRGRGLVPTDATRCIAMA